MKTIYCIDCKTFLHDGHGREIGDKTKIGDCNCLLNRGTWKSGIGFRQKPDVINAKGNCEWYVDKTPTQEVTPPKSKGTTKQKAKK